MEEQTPTLPSLFYFSLGLGVGARFFVPVLQSALSANSYRAVSLVMLVYTILCDCPDSNHINIPPTNFSKELTPYLLLNVLLSEFSSFPAPGLNQFLLVVLQLV